MKDEYVLVGRVNTTGIPIAEEGGFSGAIEDVASDIEAIFVARAVFLDKATSLSGRQSIIGWLCKNGTSIHNFNEIKKKT